MSAKFKKKLKLPDVNIFACMHTIAYKTASDVFKNYF